MAQIFSSFDIETPDVALYNGIAPDGTLQCYTTTRGGSNEFLVNGIRHHKSFAKSPEVNEICKVHDRYPRARNARLTMSNIIPDMASQAVIPYCSWYSDVATEDTYRELFYRHPEMRYHIGRAYLQNPRPGAYLNGDTAIRSSLQRHRSSIKDGDSKINRYARLRRPITVPNKITAIVPDAYYHTPFARWLETCVDELFPREYQNKLVRQAYQARFIMNDYLSRINSEVDGETLPEFFWWPHCPDENTLLATWHGNIFLELSGGTNPTQEQWEAGLQSRRKFYLENIERRAKEEDLELSDRYDLIKEIFNEPDGHSEDWDDRYEPEDNLFNYHMHLQTVKWQQFISATDKARQAVPSTSKAYSGLSSTMEDEERR
ncbi:hypothetical protein BDP55DRAFT_694438 [Colletotrichum godetiae]|uniref:Uncharacterized protein n=1 Tax=Colletotrichum godetiae TaxID=1209918 RepID=A0AAJ0AJM8_9PEZI|nr:uncharacterized protein BDP55DRAFT_694438 [Colletotrichum godetiae]KAK1675105.1 hypothetical protein BDP55DRAFT_694438 [Colletotrichum godetiae]